MATLAQLIAPHLDKTDAQIVAMLNAPSVTVRDTQLWTSAGLALLFGPEAVGQIDEVLKATPGYDWVRLLLAGKGIDFSSDVTQASLESLRGVLGSQVDALKAVGVRQISPYQEAGFEGDVTVEEVTEARTVLEAEALRIATEQRATNSWNEIVNPAVSEGKNWLEIVSLLVADLETNP